MTSNTKARKLYFGSGPAALPPEVLAEAAEAVIDYNGSGLSILEIPHRGPQFEAILEESKDLVKMLCGLGNEHEVLWLQGGGRLQFCMIPMNFLGAEAPAGYVDSGHWAHEAAKAAAYYGETRVIASSRPENYSRLPQFPHTAGEKLAYLHLTTNNTIYGTQWQHIPDTGAPLIADMSSDILSRRLDYSRFAMFYACAQKNVGPAGVTLAVLNRDLLAQQQRDLPPMLSYAAHAKHRSLLNTPPVYAVYVSLLMLRWTQQQTLAALEAESNTKSAMLYEELERNRLFQPVVTVKDHRSRTNITFRAVSEEVHRGFAAFCTARDIEGIEGHRSVGGFRVSLYNAVPRSSVSRLIELMQEYEQEISKL